MPNKETDGTLFKKYFGLTSNHSLNDTSNVKQLAKRVSSQATLKSAKKKSSQNLNENSSTMLENNLRSTALASSDLNKYQSCSLD